MDDLEQRRVALEQERALLKPYYELLEKYSWNEEAMHVLFLEFVVRNGHLNEFVEFLRRHGEELDAAETEKSTVDEKRHLRYVGGRVMAMAVVWNNTIPAKGADLLVADVRDPGFVYAMPGTLGTIIHIDTREDVPTVRWDYSGKAIITGWNECRPHKTAAQEIIDRLSATPNPLSIVMRFFNTQVRVTQLETFVREVVESIPSHTSSWFFLNGRMLELPKTDLSYESLCGLAGGGCLASRFPVMVVERANNQGRFRVRPGDSVHIEANDRVYVARLPEPE
jgi:hypothetical protein